MAKYLLIRLIYRIGFVVLSVYVQHQVEALHKGFLVDLHNFLRQYGAQEVHRLHPRNENLLTSSLKSFNDQEGQHLLGEQLACFTGNSFGLHALGNDEERDVLSEGRLALFEDTVLKGTHQRSDKVLSNVAFGRLVLLKGSEPSVQIV